jgi:hypothetical protein
MRRVTRGRRVFVIVDALGWLHVQELDVFDGLTHRAPVTTLLGYSSAAIPALLSGAGPRDNGHWSFFYRSTGATPLELFGRLARLPRSLQRPGLRAWAEQRIVRKHGISGYFHTYEIPFATLGRMDTCEPRSPFTVGGMRHGDSIIDRWERQGTPYSVHAYPVPDEQVMQRTLRDLREGEKSHILSYLTQWDATMHAHPVDSAAAGEVMDRYRVFVREILGLLRPEDRLAVFSDHGMTPVRAQTDVRAVLSANRNAIDDVIIDSTMCRVWLKEGADPDATRRAFDEVPRGHVLTSDELADQRLDFETGAFGDLIFLADPGVLVYPNHMGGAVPLGMHGYWPGEPSADAVALATHPLPEIASITDVRAVMETW